MGAEVAPLVFRKPTSKRFNDLTGQKFGLLTVKAFAGFAGKFPKWECDCQCGGSTLAFANILKQGRAQHCGCQSKHDGRTDHPLYSTWINMIGRCEDSRKKEFKHYGARGIRVCERWKEDFWAFVSDMGERPDGCSIDRIDNDGDYEPGNCRWATSAEQAANTRRCRYITYNGETKTMSEWARGLGITTEGLRLRLKKDAPLSEILTSAVGTTLVGHNRQDVHLVRHDAETPKWPDDLPLGRVLHILTGGAEDSEEIVYRLRCAAVSFGLDFKSRHLGEHVLVRFTKKGQP